jgi:hypothetical protein
MIELVLICGECGRITIPSAVEQTAILGKLVFRSQREILGFSSVHYQFGLATRPRHERNHTEDTSTIESGRHLVNFTVYAVELDSASNEMQRTEGGREIK